MSNRRESAIALPRPEVRPLIAVTTSELRSSQSITLTSQGEPPQEEMTLGLPYMRAIEQAGGIPVVVPPLREDFIESLLEHVDGVCLSGGPDIDPAAYGEPRHPELGPTWSELDAFELAVARAADARGLPILAICRGAQVFNVARGGKLYQHLPDVVGEQVNHRQRQPGPEVTHSVELSGSSRLHQVIDRDQIEVNSFHHQAVSALGAGLVATAHASDGTIEAFEASDREFALGVQWHAETLVGRPEQAALFGALIAAARRGERHGASANGAASSARGAAQARIA
jgi:putative glutamine amidotransferase